MYKLKTVYNLFKTFSQIITIVKNIQVVMKLDGKYLFQGLGVRPI